MIKITLANASVVEWDQSQYTDYRHDDFCFFIIDNGNYVGIYNMSYVISVTVTEK